MSPFLRKLSLTTHITFSVGWFGAIAAFLILAINGLINRNVQSVQSSYISMDLIAWFAIMPACLGSFASGIVQSIGTQWGLFKHYWIIVKLMLTIAATVILLLHMQPISFMADIASKISLSYDEYRSLRIRLIADAMVAIAVLIIAIVLSIYKPWGKTGYGQKVQSRVIFLQLEMKGKSPGFYVILGLIITFLLMVILHLSGGGMKGH